MKSAKVEVVACPKCKSGKMVPLSQVIHEMTASYKVVPYAEWHCVKCGYVIKTEPIQGP